jgi:hypothetical protein
VTSAAGGWERAADALMSHVLMSCLMGRNRSPFISTSPPTVTDRKLDVSSTDTALADTDAGSCTKICTHHPPPTGKLSNKLQPRRQPASSPFPA